MAVVTDLEVTVKVAVVAPAATVKVPVERLLFTLQIDETLTQAVRCILQGEGIADTKDFVRLCAAGVMIGDAPAEMRPRCELYERFLRRHLL